LVKVSLNPETEFDTEKDKNKQTKKPQVNKNTKQKTTKVLIY